MALPKVLDGSGKRINCISLSVNQTLIPLSNASMEVLKEDVLPIRTYVEIETPNGVKEVYRTRLPQVTHGYETASIQLDHAVCEVGDYVIQGELKEETTVAYALTHIFSHYRGSRWQLGTITATETVVVDCSYDNVLEQMLYVLEQVPKYYFTFDFTASPWTINLAEKSATVTAEGRLSRNISSAVVKRDDKDLCTRVFVKGLPLREGQGSTEIGYMDADTISTYGIVEAETGSGNMTQAQAERVAQAYLDAHKNPKLSVEIDGNDLYAITGETLDRLVVGKLYRLAIPDDGVVIEDYISKLSFDDISFDNPAKFAHVNVVIGEEQDAVIDFLQKQAESVKSGSKYRKKEEITINTLFSDLYATQTMIDSSIWTANSTIISYVDETATYIMERIGERTGAKVISSVITPYPTGLNEGDLWVEGNLIRLWDDADLLPWVPEDPSAYDFDWTQMKGTKLHIWKDGDWKLVQDETTISEETELVRTKNMISMIAENLKYANGEWKRNVARLDVRADKIVSSVNEQVAQIGSNIEQTASQIRSEVHAANSNLYSFVEQTATNIRSVVANVSEGLQSSIEQTACAINLSVQNSVCELRSSIQVESNRISLVVEGTGSNAKIKPASIVASINNGSSSIVISADHVNLDGYVTASALTTDWLTTKIESATNISVKKLTLQANGSIRLPIDDGYVSLTGANTVDTIKGLKVVQSGNNYKLQASTYGNVNWHDLPNTTFSRAVSSWTVGAGSGYINVTANPQSQTESVKVLISGSNTISSNGTYTYKVMYENGDGDDVETGASKSVTVNVPSGTHSISIMADTVGKSSEPDGTRIWSTTNFVSNRWYKFTVNCGSASKVYKIYINS